MLETCRRHSPFRTMNDIEHLPAKWAEIQERLLSATWKEALSRLTLGYTHDLNNLLTGILGLADTESFEGKPGENLTLIKRSAQQAAALIDQLARLHRSRRAQSEYHDLNALVRQVLAFVHRAIPKDIRVEDQLFLRPLPIYADAVEAQQAMVNLLFNAADAMPTGGTLLIRTSREESLAPLGKLPLPPVAILLVKDTGRGMAANDVSDALSGPFCSNPAKGLALGLYQVRLFAERCGGVAELKSFEPFGTGVQVSLPLADLGVD